MSELEPKAPAAAAPVRMHRVKYSLAYKKNLGNFQNVDVSVGLEQDGFGHPDVTMEKVAEWVELNLARRLAEVLEALEESSD